VTGGTGALGSAIARGLAAAGATVAILGRRQAVAQQLAQQINQQGGRSLPLPADVLDRSSLQQARQQLLDQHGRVDILVNCAGGNKAGATIVNDLTFFNMSADAFADVIQL